MTPKQLEEKAERIALSTYLSTYPDDKSYDEICDLMEEESDEVLIWFPFETDSPENIIGYMNTLRDTIISCFSEEQNEN